MDYLIITELLFAFLKKLFYLNFYFSLLRVFLTPAESFGSVRSNPKEIIKCSEKLDTVKKDNKTVSHTLIGQRIYVFGRAAGKSTSFILLQFIAARRERAAIY